MKKILLLLFAVATSMSCTKEGGWEDAIIGGVPPFHEEPHKVVLRERPCFVDSDEAGMYLTIVFQRTSPNGKFVSEYYPYFDEEVPALTSVQPITIDGVTLYPGDSVLITAWADEYILGCDATTKYYVIEDWPAVEQQIILTKQTYPKQEEATIVGVIGLVPNPCTTIPCLPGMDWAILVGEQAYIIPEIPAGFAEGDSVRVQGIVITDIDTNMEEYECMQIEAITQL